MVDTSTVFDLLSATERRRVLLLLCQTDSLDVPEGIRPRGQTARERPPGGRSSHVSSSDPQPFTALRIELSHVHLPKLEAAALIEWDRGSQTVSRGPEFDTVEPALELLAENADAFPDGLL